MSRNEPLGRRGRTRRAAPRLRDFDPDEVARLETAMWRSYYGRERARLFLQLAALMRTQYRMPFWRSNSAALRAAAMHVRDAAAERGRPTEDDWRRIDDLLHQSWRSLHQAVNQ